MKAHSLCLAIGLISLGVALFLFVLTGIVIANYSWSSLTPIELFYKTIPMEEIAVILTGVSLLFLAVYAVSEKDKKSD